MKMTERSTRRHDGFWIGVGALTLLCATAPPLHAETVQATIPSTTAHLFSSRPMIAGTVVTVNDHVLVVDTEQGERITLEVDTRTLLPRDLAPGMTVRTEFAALENCHFHADRVIPVRAGMSAQRLQAYAHPGESRENHVSTAANETRRPAASSRGSIGRPMPGTLEHLYSTRPLISGTVLSVNDHRMVVKTDQGRRVALVMDSRTMVPRAIAPGSRLRAEFKEMQDGRFYAQRIHLVGSDAKYREQAYANTIDNDIASAGIIGDCESVRPTPGNSTTATMASYQSNGYGNGSGGHGGSAGQNQTSYRDGSAGQNGGAGRDGSSASSGDGTAADDEGRDVNYRENGRTGTLPQTASPRPLVLLLGLLALGSAGVITFVRTRTG